MVLFCCYITKKGPGHRCGGKWNYLGICGEGLICSCKRCGGCSLKTLECFNVTCIQQEVRWQRNLRTGIVSYLIISSSQAKSRVIICLSSRPRTQTLSQMIKKVLFFSCGHFVLSRTPQCKGKSDIYFFIDIRMPTFP